MSRRRTVLLCVAAAVMPGSGFVRAAGGPVARPADAAKSADAAEAVRAAIAALPGYVPGPAVRGVISLWGHGSPRHDFMGALLEAWMLAFRGHHPDVALDDRLYGTASAVGALAIGRGNLAILGEEITEAASRLFERERGYPPTPIDLATGSLDVNYFDYAHMVFVHRDNPLRELSLRQLDGIFGAEHRRGGSNIRFWGELGLRGEWARTRIQPFGWKIDEDFALFFRDAVLLGSHRWNNDIREFVHLTRADGTQYDHGRQILDALAGDRAGIALSNVRYANPAVRALALGRNAGGPYFEATVPNLISQAYPLVRIIPAIVDRPPGGQIEPVVREFLRFILSREGQQLLVDSSAYLPLGAAQLRQQLERLS